jgi:ABC-type Fe3+-siderophore transport system permease subunit
VSNFKYWMGYYARLVLSGLIVYGCFSFAFADFNIIKWRASARVGCVICTLLFCSGVGKGVPSE